MWWRFSIAILAILLFAAPAMADMPFSIGAASVGYGLKGADQGEYYTHYWGGLRGYKASDITGLYVTYQNLGQNAGTDGHGVKTMLISGAKKIPDLYLMADVGVAFGLAENSDSTYTAAFTIGGGLIYRLAEYIGPYLYVSAYDSGPRFQSAVYFGLALIDLHAIAKKE